MVRTRRSRFVEAHMNDGMPAYPLPPKANAPLDASIHCPPSIEAAGLSPPPKRPRLHGPDTRSTTSVWNSIFQRQRVLSRSRKAPPSPDASADDDARKAAERAYADLKRSGFQGVRVLRKNFEEVPSENAKPQHDQDQALRDSGCFDNDSAVDVESDRASDEARRSLERHDQAGPIDDADIGIAITNAEDVPADWRERVSEESQVRHSQDMKMEETRRVSEEGDAGRMAGSAKERAAAERLARPSRIRLRKIRSTISIATVRRGGREAAADLAKRRRLEKKIVRLEAKLAGARRELAELGDVQGDAASMDGQE